MIKNQKAKVKGQKFVILEAMKWLIESHKMRISPLAFTMRQASYFVMRSYRSPKAISRMTLLIICFILNAIFLTPIQAVDSTPSSDLKSKLKVLETEIASKAAKLKQEVSKTLQNKVLLGSIKSKSDSIFILNTKKGDQQILIKDYTDFLDKTKIKYKDLKETDIIAVLGDIDNDNALAAKRIVKLSSLPIERQIIWGQFLSSSPSAAIKSQVKITIKDKTGKTIDINTSKDTDYESKSTEASLKLLKENDPLVIVGVSGKDGILFARLIYFF